MKSIVSFGIGFLVFGLIIVSSCRVVPPGHRGVVVTLGNVSPSLRGEGVCWVVPFFGRCHRMPVQQITQEGSAECYSSDLQQMTAKHVVFYRIPEKYVIELFRDYHGDPFNSLVSARFEESLKAITSTYTAENAVKKREEIKSLVLDLVRKSVGELIDIRDVAIPNIDLSDELEKAIELKQVEQQKSLAKVYELEKETKEAEITMVKARAEAESVKIKGDALKNAPGVIDLEIAKRWNGIAPLSVSVGMEGAGANILLPLGSLAK